MARLQDDPKVAELITKAEARGANAERKRINSIISARSNAAGDLEDAGLKKAIKAELKEVKTEIREGA